MSKAFLDDLHRRAKPKQDARVRVPQVAGPDSRKACRFEGTEQSTPHLISREVLADFLGKENIVMCAGRHNRRRLASKTDNGSPCQPQFVACASS